MFTLCALLTQRRKKGGGWRASHGWEGQAKGMFFKALSDPRTSGEPTEDHQDLTFPRNPFIFDTSTIW